MSFLFILVSVLLAVLIISLFFLPLLLRTFARIVGFYLTKASQGRRELLFSRTEQEQKIKRRKSSGAASKEKVVDSDVKPGPTSDWRGIIGFFHPFCNAGGGGERVLWAAIRATQLRWPNALCVVYTGDHDVDKSAMLERVKDRFNIDIHSPNIHFLYLTTRRYVLSSTWPHFTLLGQSLGSLILAYDAFSLLVPDIFVDTMGYAFAVALSSYLFPRVPTGAYVHYPTISTDMLSNLSPTGQGINAGSGVGLKGRLKRRYWQWFASLYSWVGGSIDVVMTNSTWTQSHIRSLWGPSRTSKSRSETNITVVFPPVAVEELTSQIDVSAASESQRGPYLLYVAQFRPEKNHELIIDAFAKLVASLPPNTDASKTPKLVLVGSVRDGDDASRVYQYRIKTRELHIESSVEFVCDAPWSQILDWLRKSSIGVNGMWNEHFGIGVVEYQAAGLISVVNDSGGPKEDIVVEIEGGRTGWHASTVQEYAEGFKWALGLGEAERLDVRRRARRSAERFTEGGFRVGWVREMEKLVRLRVKYDNGELAR